ncbi:ankyrin repeat domain-containing protein [Treponema pectinovorum]|uniref:ankyrin repeat domain-containing protein n=1 Tax=Treponema pectinovorum TaxID=164 RepID=UPI0011C8009A|nr:ankyrin repeat domain-containing protein [Treponema pectinovorum]
MAEKQTKNQNIEDSFEYKLAKEQTINYIWQSVMGDFVYKTKDMAAFYEQVKDIAPNRSDFFINWFKGFVSVANWDLQVAVEFYKNAFLHIQQAEEFTGRFIQQAFTFFMYVNQKDFALEIWNYGVSKKMVAILDELFFKNFNPKEQFWTQFAPIAFVDEKSTQEKVIADYKKEKKDKLLKALEDCDLKAFMQEENKVDINTYKFSGVSPLYYAIQFKATLKNGSDSYAKSMAEFRTNQLLSTFDFSKAKKQQIEEAILTVRHNMKKTYVESNLAKIMFYAYYCKDSQIEQKTEQLDEIISFIIEKTQDVDKFEMNAGSSMTNTALYLAAELDDFEVSKKLLQKGADTKKSRGKADFSFTTKQGKILTTSLPNNFIYRLITFQSWNTLKMFLTDFKNQAEPQMTAKTQKSDITPLVYLILTQVYNAPNETEYEKNKKTVDSLLPLMLDCGAKLEQKTIFGTAKSLLGL